jgi:serine/threonine protein kinase/Leucine-rich repeat (LRR) protein
MLEKSAELLDRLEQSGLLTPSIIERRDALLGAESAEQAAEELVRLKLLTEYQARAAVKDASQPLSIGDYIVEDLIGRGGMGFVLRARHRRMKRQVAIKFLHTSMTESPDLVARFEREVEAAAQLHHQNIVTAYDAGEHDGSHYLVMQYVDGEDLSHRVKRNGPLRVSEAIDVIRQAAEGLGYAHEKGIVHRDIKPGNLLLDREGVVRILDMGLARMRPSPGDALDGGAHADLTNTGSVMGTVDYMAPEQALDAKTADFSADIYSLGCTLYFLLTANPPFRSDTIMRRLLAHREQDVPLIRHVRPEAPRELDDVFAKMMAKKKEDRYPSMQHLVVALKSIELDDADAEQMATLDAPDDGNGGFIRLPEADQDDSDTGIPGFRERSAITEAGNLEASPASAATDATLIESDSQVSQTVVLSDLQPGVEDDQFSDVSGTQADAKSANEKRPAWKIGVPVVVGLVVLVGAFALSSKDGDAPSQQSPESLTAQLSDGPNDARQVDRSRDLSSDASPKVIKPEDGWVDILATASPDPSTDPMWSRDEGRILGNPAGDWSDLRLPIETSDSYEVQCEFVRSGKPESIGIGLPVGPAHVSLTLDSFNHHRHGLEPIRDQTVTYNSTGIAGGLENDRLYKLAVRVNVRADDATIVATLDGEQIVDWTGPFADLAAPQSQNSFLLRAHSCRAAFHSLQLRMVTGAAIRTEDRSKNLGSPMSPDRRAAEWVVSIGGTVHVVSSQQAVTATTANELPQEPFFVDTVELAGNPQATDDGLKNLLGLSRLRSIAAWDTPISDAGLANLTDSGQQPLPNLQSLQLERTQITDTGLRHLVDSPMNKALAVGDTVVSDPDLVRTFSNATSLNIGLTSIPLSQLDFLDDFNRLGALSLDSRQWNALAGSTPQFADSLRQVSVFDRTSTRIDERLLMKIPNLVSLAMSGPPASQFDEAFWTTLAALPEFEDLRLDAQISDGALTHLQRMPQLETLHLDSTTITGQGFAKAAQQLPGLRNLNLTNGSLTDNDVSSLAALQTLQQFALNGNQITAEGIATLRKVLPACRIISDHGTFEPDPASMSPDRRAAEWVIAQGGSVRIQATGEEPDTARKLAELPAGDFRLLDVDLSRCQRAIDDGLTVLRGLSSLEALYLVETLVSDQGLSNLVDEGRKPLTNLKRLYLDQTQVTEAGLRHLSGSTALEGLLLSKTQIRNWSVLQQFPKLASLSTNDTPAEATDLDAILKLPELVYLKTSAAHLSAIAEQNSNALSQLRDISIYELTTDFDTKVLSGLKSLRSLGLQNSEPRALNQEFWRTIAELPELADLHFTYGIDDRALAAMVPLPALTDFAINSKDVSGEGVAGALPNLPNLKSLSVSYSDWTDEDLRALTNGGSLEELTFVGNTLTRAGLEELASRFPGCRITSETVTIEPTASPDRRAAEWVLKNNGTVLVKGFDKDQQAGLKPGDQLPEWPFALVQVSINDRIEESEFVMLKGLTSLEAAYLNYFPLTDAALANLQDSSKLKSLHLEGTQITDDGLAVLEHFPQLEGLRLPSGFSDAGLARVVEKKGLKYLGIGFKSGRVDGLSRLSALTDLNELSLNHADLSHSDDGAFSLDAVRKLPGLKTLFLGVCRIDSRTLQELAVIEHLTTLVMRKCQYEGDVLSDLSRFEHLEELQLPQSELTDSIVSALSQLTNLKSLNIKQNDLTPEGIAELRDALPGCRIESDHGTFTPTAADPAAQN